VIGAVAPAYADALSAYIAAKSGHLARLLEPSLVAA
jgi:hypothetical protein